MYTRIGGKKSKSRNEILEYWLHRIELIQEEMQVVMSTSRFWLFTNRWKLEKWCEVSHLFGAHILGFIFVFVHCRTGQFSYSWVESFCLHGNTKFTHINNKCFGHVLIGLIMKQVWLCWSSDENKLLELVESTIRLNNDDMCFVTDFRPKCKAILKNTHIQKCYFICQLDFFIQS